MYESNYQFFRRWYGMKTTICDRCEKQIPPPNHYSCGDITKIAIDYVLPNPHVPILSNNTQTRNLDICPNCSKELKKILRENNLIF